jgi:hypothetical protein
MKRYLLTLAALLPLSALASAQYIRTDDAVPNAAKVAARIAEKLGEPVAYPSMLPSQSNKLHAYGETDAKIGAYTIFLDSQPGCKGAHYCNVGALSVSKGQTPADLRDLQGRDITVKVKLANGQDAYFTPGHAMGDFWPAQIQWTRDGALYSLVWNGKFPDGELRTMTTLADSVTQTAR